MHHLIVDVLSLGPAARVVSALGVKHASPAARTRQPDRDPESQRRQARLTISKTVRDPEAEGRRLETAFERRIA